MLKSSVLILVTLLLASFSPTVAVSEPYKEKSEKMAQDLSVSGTVIPVVVGVVVWAAYRTGGEPSRKIPIAFIYGGLILGPSWGYFYTESVPRGLLGIGMRTAIGLYTISVIQNKEEDNELRIPNLQNSFFLVGTSFMAVSAIYDIFEIRESVRKHNRKQWDKSFMLTPRYFSESKAVGLGIEMKF